MTLAPITKKWTLHPAFHLLAGLALLCTTCIVSAGTLQLGNPTLRDGQYVFPVLLQGSDEGVAALDFRLAYDPSVFTPVGATMGRSAVVAQKQVNSNVSAPGEFVVVLMGFNQNTVAPGEVVEIVMEKIGEPAGGSTLLQIDDPTLATNVGVEVDSRGLSKTVHFDENGNPGPKRDDVEGPETDGGPPTSPEGPKTGDHSEGPGRRNNGIGIGPLYTANGGNDSDSVHGASDGGVKAGGAEASGDAMVPGAESAAIVVATNLSPGETSSPVADNMPGGVDDSQRAVKDSFSNSAQDSDGISDTESTPGMDDEITSQPTDNTGVINNPSPSENKVNEGGRQRLPKYATLVLLVVGTPLGIFGVLRFIGR